MNEIKSTDFIAWDPLFFEVIGKQATFERIQSFEGERPTVHEAPAYVPETNELIYADTSVTGWLWAIDVDTLKVCPLTYLTSNNAMPSMILRSDAFYLGSQTENHASPAQREWGTIP